MIRIGLGGGCHWCTEAVIQQVPQVINVNQGYIKSTAPHDSFSEAVLVELDAYINLELLLEVHLATHASTVLHSRHEEYRSAIYYKTDYVKKVVEQVMITLSRKHNKKYVTKILPLKFFKPSRESLQDYYLNKPDAPFCKRYILPKLNKLDHIKEQYKS